MDSIGNFLTIIRNASLSGKETCEAPWSKMRESIAKVLKEKGFIRAYERDQNQRGHKFIHITLKYVDQDAVPAITVINRKSKPGRRLYYGHKEIPRVLGGLGISILSTSNGVVSDHEARNQNVGGELICQIW